MIEFSPATDHSTSVHVIDSANIKPDFRNFHRQPKTESRVLGKRRGNGWSEAGENRQRRTATDQLRAPRHRTSCLAHVSRLRSARAQCHERPPRPSTGANRLALPSTVVRQCICIDSPPLQ